MLRFNKNKKAASFVMELVIIAAIALLVAIVLSTGLGKSFTNLFKNVFPKCEGTCKSSCDGYLDYQSNGECPNNQVCCLPQPGTEADIATENTETPSVGTGLCKDNKEGDKCGTNQVCDSNLVCTSKCVYCSNIKDPSKKSICTTFLVKNENFLFTSGYDCTCSLEEYSALPEAGVSNIAKDAIYHSASGFCPGDNYCCNLKDTKPPELKITTNQLGGGFPSYWYNVMEINVVCNDPVQNGQETGCEKGFWYAFIPSNMYCPTTISEYNYSIENKLNFDLSLINKHPLFFNEEGTMMDNINICFLVKDKAGRKTEFRTPAIKYTYVNTCTICSNIPYFPCLCKGIVQNNFILNDPSKYCLYCAATGELSLIDDQATCLQQWNQKSCKG